MPSAQRAPSNASVRPAQYVAEQPFPDEPLGFHGAKYQPAAPMGGPFEAGVFDVPAGPSYDLADLADPADPDAPAPAVGSGEWIRSGDWYTQQSVVYMSRSTRAKNWQRLAVDVTSAIIPHYDAVLVIPVPMGYQPGLRSTFGRYLGRDAANRDHSVEFTFLGLTHWHLSDNITARTPGGIFSIIDNSFNVPVFNASNSQSFTQTSTFNSYEFNYRIERRPPRDQLLYTRDSTWLRDGTPWRLPALFAGVRVVTVNERLNYTAQSDLGNGAYNILTHNNMVGLQTGLDWGYDNGLWRLGARINGAGLVNWTDQSSQVRILDLNGNPLAPNRNERAATDIPAFLGELTFNGMYRPRPNVAFRASFGLTWLTNQALVSNQVTFADTTIPHVSDQHSLFYQSVSIGFEINR